MLRKRGLSKRFVVLLVPAILLIFVFSASACTDVVVGKKASVDGSVMTSHTADGWYDSNVRPIFGKKHDKGETVGVYWNIIGEEKTPPKKIGEIPQVEETYTYFRVGYPFMNENQLMIGETTIGQKDELKTFYPEGKAIMTIEQLEVFALQRAKTAREAIKVIGALAEKYGFMPSCCNQGECITIADKNEAWVFEIHSVGFNWKPGNGKPGAIWVAQRVPDDEITVVPNISRIQEVDISNPDIFMASENYMDPAIEHGWFDPDSGEDFNWQKAYSPKTGGWSLASMWVRNRLYCIYSKLAPSQEWDPYGSTESYPFSIKPEEKVSVKTVMSFLRSTMEGSPFNMEEHPSWIVQDDNGEAVKSVLATPFPNKAMRQLLNIPYHRPVSKRASYSFVSQSRSKYPDPIGGVLWFAFEKPYMSSYVPIYCGVQGTPESWRTFDRDSFTLDSARWVISLADDLVSRRFQVSIKELKEVRKGLEDKFIGQQKEIDKKALALYEEDPSKAKKFLTEYTSETMAETKTAYWDLCKSLISQYTSNKYW